MVVGILVAAGKGERFGACAGKQLALALGRPLIAYSFAALADCDEVDSLVLVADPGREDSYRAAAAPAGLSKPVSTVAGGETRQESVFAGLSAVPSGTDVVVVHDGARPLVTPGLISEAVRAVTGSPGVAGAVVGHPAYDTVKRVDVEGAVLQTLDRSELWVAQTPQVFRAEALLEAHRLALADGYSGTDDASLVERAGGRVVMVPGPRGNVKVTVPEDLAFVEAVLAARCGE